jgi:hypothetical protein
MPVTRQGLVIEQNSDAFVGISVLVFTLVGAILTALLAWRRGRSPIGWGVAGLILPLFALIALALLPSRRQVVNAPTQRQGWNKNSSRLEQAVGALHGREAMSAMRKSREGGRAGVPLLQV